MDVTASLSLANGRECKIITDIDDHSRFCASLPSCCGPPPAQCEGMQECEIPGEALSDNDKQFTGRFGRPARPRSCSSGSAGTTASPNG